MSLWNTTNSFDDNARPAAHGSAKPCGKRDGLIDEEVSA